MPSTTELTSAASAALTDEVVGNVGGATRRYTLSVLRSALGAVLTSQVGAASGVASLDSSGKVPAAQLPSYVDDVIEATTLAALPATGEAGKIYVAIDTGRVYRWSGSTYIEISPSPGSTDAVAEGLANLYFSQARVRATLLTGLGSGSASSIAATDALIDALAKLQAQISTLAAGGGGGGGGSSGGSSLVPINFQFGTSYTYSSSDVGCKVRHSNIQGITGIVPTHDSDPIPVGAVIRVRQARNGAVTIQGASGVGINVPLGFTTTTARNNAEVVLHKIGLNDWDLNGELA